jgi:hypothetical protein
MRLKAALYLCFLMACSTLGTAQADDPAKKLEAFVGKWESESTRLETPFSHADKITSSLECRWSPQGDFLVCEQFITDSNGKHTQLSIYSYNSKDGNYSISSLAGPGSKPWNGTITLDGKVWTYPGAFEANGKKIVSRTINDFSVPGKYTFKSEFSEDGGAHWTTTLQRTAHKTAD